MSNHDGSYMLNEVLKLLDRYEFFNTIGKGKTHSFISQILKLSQHYDCNEGEILEEIGKKLGICYYCGNYASNLAEDGVCLKCIEA